MPAVVKKIAWPTIAIIASMIGTLAGAVWAASQFEARVTAVSKVAEDHESRLRAIEAKATDIAADVRWIKTHLQQTATSGGRAHDLN